MEIVFQILVPCILALVLVAVIAAVIAGGSVERDFNKANGINRSDDL